MKFEMKELAIEYGKQAMDLLNKKTEYNYIQNFIDDPMCLAYIVLYEEKVVGFIYGYIQRRLESESMLYIHSVDTHQEYRNRGIATMMVNRMLKYAEEHDFVRTYLISNEANKSAVKLYSKTGGKVIHNDSIVFEFDGVIK